MTSKKEAYLPSQIYHLLRCEKDLIPSVALFSIILGLARVLLCYLKGSDTAKCIYDLQLFKYSLLVKMLQNVISISKPLLIPTNL